MNSAKSSGKKRSELPPCGYQKSAEEYRSLPSLQEYLLVAQDRCHIEHYVRQNQQQWLMTEYNELNATITLNSIQCQLLLADVYDKLIFPAPAVEPAADAEA